MPSLSPNSTRQPRLPDVDAEIGDALVEVKFGASSMRTMGGALMKLVSALGSRPGFRGYLALVDAELTLPRLKQEWERLSHVFRPDLLDRLHLSLVRGEQVAAVPEELPAEVQSLILQTVAAQRGQVKNTQPSRSTEAFFHILRVLIIHWFRRSGPLTTKQLIKETGFTYPTIAEAITRLGSQVVRHSDRRVELARFPRDAWFELLAKSAKVRHTQGYADRSGKPRPVEVLVSRLNELQRDDIAISGVLGARHFQPGLDLIGTPKLDLVIHSPQTRPSHDFLRRIDAALKPVEPGELPYVSIHTIYRPTSLFITRENAPPWADEVECLLDLHAMRLESQAVEFIEHLTKKGGTA